MLKRIPFELYFVIYFSFTSLLRWRLDWGLLWWWLGGLLGAGMLWVDRLVYVYVVAPHEQLSIQVKHMLADKRWRDAMRLLASRGSEQAHLVSLSVLFMLAWVGLAAYVISSSGSLGAVGVVMGVGWRLVSELMSRWGERERLKAMLFWQIKRPISDQELKVVTWSYLVVFGLLSMAVV